MAKGVKGLDRVGSGKRVPDNELTETQKRHVQENKDAADKLRRSTNMAPWAVRMRKKLGRPSIVDVETGKKSRLKD
jgi:hypothetical protein